MDPGVGGERRRARSGNTGGCLCRSRSLLPQSQDGDNAPTGRAGRRRRRRRGEFICRCCPQWRRRPARERRRRARKRLRGRGRRTFSRTAARLLFHARDAGAPENGRVLRRHLLDRVHARAALGARTERRGRPVLSLRLLLWLAVHVSVPNVGPPAGRVLRSRVGLAEPGRAVHGRQQSPGQGRERSRSRAGWGLAVYSGCSTRHGDSDTSRPLPLHHPDAPYRTSIFRTAAQAEPPRIGGTRCLKGHEHPDSPLCHAHGVSGATKPHRRGCDSHGGRDGAPPHRAALPEQGRHAAHAKHRRPPSRLGRRQGNARGQARRRAFRAPPPGAHGTLDALGALLPGHRPFLVRAVPAKDRGSRSGRHCRPSRHTTRTWNLSRLGQLPPRSVAPCRDHKVAARGGPHRQAGAVPRSGHPLYHARRGARLPRPVDAPFPGPALPPAPALRLRLQHPLRTAASPCQTPGIRLDPPDRAHPHRRRRPLGPRPVQRPDRPRLQLPPLRPPLPRGPQHGCRRRPLARRHPRARRVRRRRRGVVGPRDVARGHGADGQCSWEGFQSRRHGRGEPARCGGAGRREVQADREAAADGCHGGDGGGGQHRVWEGGAAVRGRRGRRHGRGVPPGRVRRDGPRVHARRRGRHRLDGAQAAPRQGRAAAVRGRGVPPRGAGHVVRAQIACRAARNPAGRDAADPWRGMEGELRPHGSKARLLVVQAPAGRRARPSYGRGGGKVARAVQPAACRDPGRRVLGRARPRSRRQLGLGWREGQGDLHRRRSPSSDPQHGARLHDFDHRFAIVGRASAAPPPGPPSAPLAPRSPVPAPPSARPARGGRRPHVVHAGAHRAVDRACCEVQRMGHEQGAPGERAAGQQGRADRLVGGRMARLRGRMGPQDRSVEQYRSGPS